MLPLGSVARAEPAIEIGARQFGGVFTADESATLELAIRADADGFRGRLVVAAVDAYGRSAGRTSGRVNLVPNEATTRTFSLRKRRLGHVTVDATLIDRTNGVQTTASATAAIVPRLDASDPERSAVGYVVLPNDSELPRAYEIASEMRRLGIRWVRFAFNWWLDDRRDRPDVNGADWLDSSSYEQWVDAFTANGIKVVGVLFGTARWASSAIDLVDLVGGIPHWGLSPPIDADWRLFVATLAERLRDRVRDWEVWNEPDIGVFWVGTASDYVPLARSAAAVLRSVDPGARVVLNLVNRSPEGVVFTDTVLAGAGDVFDVFGFHYDTADARDYMSFLRPGAAIWNTESHGVPRRHISRFLAERAIGVEKIFPFIYHTMLDDVSWPDANRFGRYPVNLDFTPRPDAVALRTLSDLVGSATLRAAEPAGLGYAAYSFVSAAGQVVALADGNENGTTWSPDRAVELSVKVPREIRRLAVVDLMGNRRSVRVRKGVVRLRMDGMAVFLLPRAGDDLGLPVVLSAGLAGPR